MNKLNKATESKLLVDWNCNSEDPENGSKARAQRARQGKVTPRRDIGKRVAFEPNASYRVVEHHSAFSSREISSIWYQEAEFFDFRKDIKRSARAMAKGRKEGIEVVRSRSNPELGSGAGRTRVYCYRGIEHLQSAQVLRARQNERQRLMEAVLTNQGLMPKHLAKISLQMSNEGIQRAIDAGKKDAEEARECFVRRASDSLLR